MVLLPRIAAVSNLDTVPFIYGIGHEGNFRAELLLTSPALCIENFVEGRADIALLPITAIPALKSAELLTDYCISTSGSYTSVIVSQSPIAKIRRIFCDPNDFSSLQLAGYLATHRWKITPEWVELLDVAQMDVATEGDAFLLCGETALTYSGRFTLRLDLAAEWHAQTTLPFVFSAWVARKGTSYEVTDALEEALTFGIERTYEAVVAAHLQIKPDDAYEHLSRDIDYLFDHQKHKAMQLLWDSGMKITLRANPG